MHLNAPNERVYRQLSEPQLGLQLSVQRTKFFDLNFQYLLSSRIDKIKIKCQIPFAMFFLSCVLIFLNLFYFLQISLPIHTYVQIYDIIFSRFFLKKFLDIFSFTIQWLASSTVVRTSLLINIFLFFVSFLFLFCFDILSFDSLILFLIKTLFRHFPTDLFQSVGCL